MNEFEKQATLLVENWLADTQTEVAGSAIKELKSRIAVALDGANETGFSRAMAPPPPTVVVEEYVEGTKVSVGGPGGSGGTGSSEGQVVS